MSGRVLVTGATGFVGRQVLEPLRARGFEVVTASRADGVDLLDPSTHGPLLERARPSHLLHLAWYAEPGKYWTSEENHRWVEASLQLLHAFGEAGGTRAVVAGTCAEYRWEDETHCVEGVTPVEPATVYGAAKNALRRAAEAWAADAGVSLAWGRIFFLFGPGEDPRRLVGSVARSLVRGEPAETSHGEQVRDFLSTVDLGDGFAALLDSDVEGAVNVAAGEPLRIRDVVEAFGEAAGRPDLIRLGARPANPAEPAVLTADATRMREEVGWRPSGTLEQRAAETIAWWRQVSEGGGTRR